MENRMRPDPGQRGSAGAGAGASRAGKGGLAGDWGWWHSPEMCDLEDEHVWERKELSVGLDECAGIMASQ